MTQTARHTTLLVRIAWLATFVLPLALASLLLAGAAFTAPASPAFAPFSLEEETEAAEEAAFEACLAAEEDFEAGLIDEATLEAICAEEGEAATESAAARCPIRSANAHATLRRTRLKVTLGYTTNSPVRATVEIYRGATRIAALKRQLGRSGVVRFGKPLPRKLLGKRTVIRLKLPAGGAGCPSRRLVLTA